MSTTVRFCRIAMMSAAICLSFLPLVMLTFADDSITWHLWRTGPARAIAFVWAVAGACWLCASRLGGQSRTKSEHRVRNSE
jgi:hypothetical protein